MKEGGRDKTVPPLATNRLGLSVSAAAAPSPGFGKWGPDSPPVEEGKANPVGGFPSLSEEWELLPPSSALRRAPAERG